jgi:hypothetical protein
MQRSEDFLPFLAYPARPECSTSAQLQDWADRHGLLTRNRMRRIFTTTFVGQFADLAYRWADSDGRELADCWCLWTLLVDELFEARVKAGTLGPRPGSGIDPAADLALVTSAPDEIDSALQSALKDLTQRSCAGRPAAWCAGLTAHVADFVRSCHIEALYRLEGTAVSMEEFIAVRRGSFATGMFLDLVETLTDSSLPAGEPFDELGAGIRACAADLGGWCNDLISYRRERGVETQNNLVLRLAADADTGGGSREDEDGLAVAVERARTMVADRAWELLELKAELPLCLRADGVPHPVAVRALRWAHAVETLVSGSLSFQLISARWSGA